MPDSREYDLYLAAKKNDLRDVMSLLAAGAHVIDMRTMVEAPFHTYGFDEGIYLSSALHYALKHRNLEMMARLAASAMDNKVIDTAVYQYAAFLDKNISSAIYVYALYNPLGVIQQLNNQGNEAKKGVTQKSHYACKVFSDDKNNPFQSYNLENMLLPGSKGDPKIADLNSAVAQTYLQARVLYDSASLWTIGKKYKARRIVEQLVYLQSVYRGEEPSPDVSQYFSDISSGTSLTDLLRAKRVSNPFVMFAESWKNIQAVFPSLEKSEDHSGKIRKAVP